MFLKVASVVVTLFLCTHAFAGSLPAAPPPPIATDSVEVITQLFRPENQTCLQQFAALGLTGLSVKAFRPEEPNYRAKTLQVVGFKIDPKSGVIEGTARLEIFQNGSRDGHREFSCLVTNPAN